MRVRHFELDSFTVAYLVAALWSTNDESNERGGEPMDSNYDLFDLSDKALSEAIHDCTKFQNEFGHLLNRDNCKYLGCPVTEYAGHHFWLTRNGHGCGFWDGAWEEPAATVLTEASKVYREVDLYVGDDKRIYS